MLGEGSTVKAAGQDKAYFRKFWEHRWLTVSLAYAELQQTIIKYPLSYFWWLLEPILVLCCYVFLVTVLGRGGPRAGIPFFIFVFVGILPWYWTTRCIGGGVNLINQYSGPITQIKFPKLTLVVARFFHETTLFLVGNVITVVLLSVYGLWPNFNWFYWPLLLLLHSLLILAMMMFFSAQVVSVPDLGKLMPFVLRLWFYGTPILYDVNMAKSHLSAKLMYAIKLNPLAYLAISYRDILLFNKPPNMTEYMIWISVLAFLLVACAYNFIRRERNFARYL